MVNSKLNEFVKIACPHPQCGMTFRFDHPGKGGIYTVKCPYCHNSILGKISPIHKEAAPSPSPESDSPVVYGKLVQPRRFPNPNREWLITKLTTIIGRADNNSPSDIQIDGDPYISRQSVELKVTNGASGHFFTCKILKSRNQVSVNNSELMPGITVNLNYGDTLSIGQTTILRLEQA